MKKLKQVLLVDDSFDDNFFHRKLLEDLDVAEEIHECYDGLEAVDYLTCKGKYQAKWPHFPKPDLVLLDLHMPKMDGKEFLGAYQLFPEELKYTKVIVMVTAAFPQETKAFLESNPLLKGFIGKPLTDAAIRQILHDHFPNHVPNP